MAPHIALHETGAAFESLFWRFRAALDPAASDFPRLPAHYERMMARPALRRTVEIESAIGYELPD